jgi:uncharacterized protein
VVASYVATSAIRVVDGRPVVSPVARRHLGLLAAGFLVVLAWSYWLDRYADRDRGAGGRAGRRIYGRPRQAPGPADRHAPALLAAIAVGIGAWHGTRRLPLAGAVTLFSGCSGLIRSIPALIQKLVVEPNEYPRETAFIEQHLTFTREAFGLADLRREPLPYPSPRGSTPSRPYAAGRRPALGRAPAAAGLRAAAEPLPVLRLHQRSHRSVRTARAAEQVAISVRELDTSRLAESARTWQNLHLQYVSSEGVVVSPTARMADDASPVLYLSDLNPTRISSEAPDDLRLDESSIYFSEQTRGYVLVDESDGPLGVPLDALWKKVVFAWAFQSRNLLLSGEVTDESRIVYGRQVVDRARAVAPFLHFSRDRPAVPVIHEGRVQWIVDGFTTSASFPLARRSRSTAWPYATSGTARRSRSTG